MNGPSYLIRLQPLPDNQDPDGLRRLRALLKGSLRQYRLRCLELRPEVSRFSSCEQDAAEQSQLLKEWLA